MTQPPTPIIYEQPNGARNVVPVDHLEAQALSPVGERTHLALARAH
jgi:hypothetical protein